jgi:putative permease
MYEVLKGWVNRFLSEEESILLAVLLLAASVVIIWMGGILAPFFTGIVLAFVMQGIIKSMLKIGVPHSMAVASTFLLFLGIFVVTLLLVIPRVWRQLRNLYAELPNMVTRTQELLADLPSKYPAFVSQNQVDTWVEMLNAEVGDIGQAVVTFSLAQLPVLITFAVYTVLVPIMVLFLLKDKDEILDWCKSFLPEHRPLMNRIFDDMNQQMANYIRGKVAEIIIVGLTTYVFFIFFGLDYAALLAFLVGLSVIVPYIGVLVVTVPVVIIAYLQFGVSDELMWLIIGHTVIQMLDGFVLVPMLFSEAVNLHPIAIIVAVLVFGSWWGLWGVFFAIPLATLIKSIMNAWPHATHGKEEVPT